MPELPEVEVICRGLAPRLVGETIVGVSQGAKRLRRQAEPGELAAVVGQRVAALTRRGKYLLASLGGGQTLLFHLGMTGRLFYQSAACPPLPHTHLIFHLASGQQLVFQDVRRFGQVLCYPAGVLPPPLAQVGPEPWSRHLTAARLRQQTARARRPIKNFLLDGRGIAGLGNIYACEALFAARLHPQTPVGDLSREAWSRLLRAIRTILKRAIAAGGTTIATFQDCQGQTGLFKVQLQVYGRAGEPCGVCGGAIVRSVQAGRSTFFCPHCQPAA